MLMIIKFVSKVPIIFPSSKPVRVRNETLGRIAEALTRLFLLSKGYRVIKNRYRNPFGEIDLIVRRGKTIVFCEVKYRPTRLVGAESITPIQQQRIVNGAKHFLLKHPNFALYNLRFDAILCDPKGIQHLQNAWVCETVF